MAFTHKILLCYSILLLLAVLAQSNKSAPDLDHIDDRVSPPRRNDTPPPPEHYIDDVHEPRPPNDDYDQLIFRPPKKSPPPPPPPPPELYIDAHEARPSNDDYDQLTIPPAKYHIDQEAPPSDLIIVTPVFPPWHNDHTHDSRALPDHDGNEGYEGMLPNNYKVTGAESTDQICYGPCSRLPKRCLIFCREKGHVGGICLPKIIIKPIITVCCCFLQKHLA